MGRASRDAMGAFVCDCGFDFGMERRRVKCVSVGIVFESGSLREEVLLL